MHALPPDHIEYPLSDSADTFEPPSLELWQAIAASSVDLGELATLLHGAESEGDWRCAARAWLQSCLAAGRTETMTPASGDLLAGTVQAAVKLENLIRAGIDRHGFSALCRQLQPILSTDPWWLSGIAAAGAAHGEVSACLWPVYQRRLYQLHTPGGGMDGLRVLRHGAGKGESLLVGPWMRADLDVSALAHAVFNLALGTFTQSNIPEVVGYALGCVYVHRALDNAIAGCTLMDTWPGRFSAQCAAAIERCVLSMLAQADLGVRQRLYGGVQLPFAFAQLLTTRLDVIYSPADLCEKQKVMQILQRKWPYARGHHREKKLADRCLESWFTGPATEAKDLLAALADSYWVEPGQPRRSRLLTELTAFGGPMYKVFTPTELSSISGWIESLGRSTATDKPVATPVTSGTSIRSNASMPDIRGYDRVSLNKTRTLFHRFVNHETEPGSYDQARAYVQHLLRRTDRSAWVLRSDQRRFVYTEPKFRARIQEVYAAAMAGYRPLRGRPWLTRSDYVWLLTQLAPLFLVDGCWLQRTGTLMQEYPELTPGLLAIFADEIGDGGELENHACIFRKLLAAEDVHLPAITSEEFSQCPLLLGATFEMPSFFLAISLLPRTFLPELLGLNLAIELSGLGGFYMRLIDELNYYGFDSKIISLHVSIDNLACGHSAIACDLVTTFLDSVRRAHGDEVMQEDWRRIWRGYLCLNYLTQRLLRSLTLAYGARAIASKLRRFNPNRSRGGHRR